MGTGSFRGGVKYGRGVLLTTDPLLVPWSWKSEAITLPTLWATTGPVTGTPYLTLPIVQEAGWSRGPVWAGGKSRPTGIRSPDRSARSQSVNRMSYPAHTRNAYLSNFVFALCGSSCAPVFLTFCITLPVLLPSSRTFFNLCSSFPHSQLPQSPYKTTITIRRTFPRFHTYFLYFNINDFKPQKRRPNILNRTVASTS